MRRLIRFLLLTLCLLIFLPSFPVSSQSLVLIEGLHVDIRDTHHGATTIRIHATKRTTAAGSSSVELYVYYRYKYVDGSRDFETTVTLSDPNQLKTSKYIDLATLDTTIQVQQHRIICTEVSVCEPETVETVPFELHLAVLANGPVVEDAGLFTRGTTYRSATGIFTLPDLTRDINGGELMPSGYNFSSKAPPPTPDTIGIFRPSAATFYLRNSNSTGIADREITFGSPIDFPIVGDWNGDGIDTIGVYRTSTGQFFLTDSWTSDPITSYNYTKYNFTLGQPDDQPLVGDWDGDGRDGVGVFRPSNGLIYLKNDLSTGFADYTMVMGSPGDVGIAGDWNGDGKDSPGVYRPSNAVFYVTNSVCNCNVVADASLTFGVIGDTPFIGDWDADGKSGIGIYRRSNGLTYIKNTLITGFADATFTFGSASDYPLAGYWSRVSPVIPAASAPTAPSFEPAKSNR